MRGISDVIEEDSSALRISATGPAPVGLAVVFLALAAFDLTALKVIGVGLTLAVALDATIVRTLLVPAIMRLAGEAKWWAPRRYGAVTKGWDSPSNSSRHGTEKHHAGDLHAHPRSAR
ncbi:MMPL family transporter [Knoellia aerolata]|uniref:Membrane transport protein MMPL domain-containing protein n=1 Tax=Knoellia aerolata DSM 18566 TaxID=1385519 RepID=A0A0A0JY77_9MICO|nr:MMPL family transporter [Knoellia aerolata]KGN40992.1 hypothetical protein N801_09930 [Knoellia aerolata DSM 18566]